MSSEDDLFYTLVNRYDLGDEVDFPCESPSMEIKGELRKVFCTGGSSYVTIYSFYLRKEVTYKVNDALELTGISKDSRPFGDELIYYDLNKKSSSGLIKKISQPVLMVLLLSMLLPLFPRLNFAPSNFTYSEFLSKRMSLNRLYDTTISRVHYQREARDTFFTPRSTWEKKSGDCEDLAAVCADYLQKKGKEAYVVGLFKNGEAEGHAVVFTKEGDNWVMMDLTRAIEYNGLRTIYGAKSLEEALAYYGSDYAAIFKIPGYDGEKRIHATIPLTP